ncbi:MAG: VWA domain-containing protein [Anaerolineae bacterium]|nr:VWA domain-containing protein [Anaerolineae bacterium]MDW8070240.1 VWA domain-containing protein [Anaerolineae bacterium]
MTNRTGLWTTQPSGQRVLAQSGQSFILLAIIFMGLLALLGLALDLGLLYIERIHMKRAIDAATLAGVVELPHEEPAIMRAVEYLRMNGYNVGRDVNVLVMGYTRAYPGAQPSTLRDRQTPHEYITATVNPPRATFLIDTYSFRSSPLGGGTTPDTASKIAITGTVNVPMNFMQFFGYRTVRAQDVAVAQNITNLDIVLVFDRSGSMQGDTICYQCWQETTNDVANYPFPTNGVYNPISYTLVMSRNLCRSTPEDYVDSQGRRYVIIEAELYSRNDSSYYRETRQTGIGYWALQRGTTGSGRSSSIEGTRSAHVAHNPYWTYGQASPPAPLFGRFYTLQDAQRGVAPRLEYDFRVSWSGIAYIWLRAQGGGSQSFWVNLVNGQYYRDPSKIYWAVDSNPPVENSAANSCNTTYDYAGSSSCTGSWSWIRIGSFNVISGSLHTLKIWAGSPGYEIDKIVITNDSRTDYSQIEPLTFDSGRGRPATVGSARAGACDPCNPIFGLTVNPQDCTTPYYLVTTRTNRLGDDLFSDFEPLRTSQEAVKRFVQKLDPQFDQVGFAAFSTDASRTELSCLHRHGRACYDPLVQNPPISYTQILRAIEEQTAEGGTDIAEAMRAGLGVLGLNVDGLPGWNNNCDGSANSACGRGGAAKRVMILLTDGSPNDNPGGACDDDPSLWPYNNDPDFDCVMYYARKARQTGTVVYTIGLGNGVIPELLQAVADETQGTYYFAPSPEDLDNIFDQILANIYVRLIR